jgi:hypothetical protein
MKDFFDNFFSLDQSLLANAKTLLIRPQIVVQGYLKGYRRYYYSPGKWLVIASIAIALCFYLTQSSFFIVSVKDSDIQHQFIFLFLFLLLLSFSSYLSYYLPTRKNFTEHFVINIYHLSIWTLIFTPLAIVDHLLQHPDLFAEICLFVYLLLIIIWDNKVLVNFSLGKRLSYILIHLIILVISVAGITYLT